MPLFLALVRQAGVGDPALARAALAGLAAYEAAARAPAPAAKPEIARIGGATLRDHGGDGPPAVLVPSLINPPHILDLDAQVSLAGAVAAMGRRALLLDWGEARQRAALDVAGHVETILVPLLRDVARPAALIGYCLGGTMALAAANLVPCERVATLAAPWHFGLYPADSRAALARIWGQARAPAEALGALPMEVLQAAFWSLDPLRTVSKFARFGELDPAGAEAQRFVALEDWANEGEPLPFPAARELIEELFARDLPGTGGWGVGGHCMGDALSVPMLHLTAGRDRIAPAATAPAGPSHGFDCGHVGMVVGSARHALHAALARFLDPLAAFSHDG
ncbi:MAG: alpha/beta hydrolase [Sphingomicrobium sp.]